MEKSSLIRLTAVATIVALFVLISNGEVNPSELSLGSAINAVKGKLLIIGMVGFSFGLWAEKEEKSENSKNALDLLVRIPSNIILTLSLPVGVAGALGFLGSFS